jgi:hypothetical protein
MNLLDLPEDYLIEGACAYNGMGTFRQPADPSLNGLTLMEWEIEMSQRIWNAIATRLINEGVITND